MAEQEDNGPEASQQNSEEEPEVRPADFETAMEYCGFGTFNVYLLLIAIPIVSATIFESSTMSYILPTAECDLQLTLMDKGILNGVTYAGMIVSAIPWGYIADTMSRKKVLVYGLLPNGLSVLAGALAQSAVQLMFCKFASGLFICGPFAVLMAYLSEFHGKKHRSRVMMTVGLMKSAAGLILPTLAYFLLPRHIRFTVLGFKFHTWQIFIALTSIPALLGGTLLTVFPESPKFLMAQGKTDKALKSLKTIYALNTGKSRSSFPVKVLLDEAPERTARRAQRNSVNLGIGGRRSFRERTRAAKESFIEGMRQLKPICSRPYVCLANLAYCCHFLNMMGQNSLRLWLPQIFASTTEFEKKDLGASSMCAILGYNLNKSSLVSGYSTMPEDCDVHIAPETYSKNIIVALSGLLGFIVASYLIDKLGNKWVLISCLTISWICGVCLYFSISSTSTLVISAIFYTVSSVSATTLISVAVNLFPTSIRTMMIVLIMTCGRFGSLFGSIIFPILIAIGCWPPFLMIASVMFCSSVITCFFPRNTAASFR